MAFWFFRPTVNKCVKTHCVFDMWQTKFATILPNYLTDYSRHVREKCVGGAVIYTVELNAF